MGCVWAVLGVESCGYRGQLVVSPKRLLLFNIPDNAERVGLRNGTRSPSLIGVSLSSSCPCSAQRV